MGRKGDQPKNKRKKAEGPKKGAGIDLDTAQLVRGPEGIYTIRVKRAHQEKLGQALGVETKEVEMVLQDDNKDRAQQHKEAEEEAMCVVMLIQSEI